MIILRPFLLIVCVFFLAISTLAVGEEKAKSANEYKEPYFKIDLPNGWRGGAGADPTLWQYTSPDQSEQLSVTVLISKTPIAEQDRSAALDEFLRARLTSETGQAKSNDLKLSQSVKKKQGNGWVAFYSGFHPEAQRHFANFTTINERLIANFYYEALNVTDADFQKRYRQIIGTVSVVE